jgi:integrase
LRQAGVECWSPNRLRHTRGTEIRERHGIDAAQIILGHSSPDVTKIYAEATLKKAKEIMRKMDEFDPFQTSAD